jgi:hypothetical protein
MAIAFAREVVGGTVKGWRLIAFSRSGAQLRGVSRDISTILRSQRPRQAEQPLGKEPRLSELPKPVLKLSQSVASFNFFLKDVTFCYNFY